MAGLRVAAAIGPDRQRLGREGVPLAIVDDAHPAPEDLRAAALSRPFARTEGDFYPGVRAPVPDDYPAWLGRVAATAWGSGLAVLRASFAIASDPPARFTPIQRIPHVDTLDADVVAAIHYLCGPPHGGTSLFRHRRTGYERIDRARHASWRQALALDLRDHGRPGEDSLPGDAAGFERIGGADLRFNRLILYPANCLHAGDLSGLSSRDAPKLGRLTITCLLATAGSPA